MTGSALDGLTAMSRAHEVLADQWLRSVPLLSAVHTMALALHGTAQNLATTMGMSSHLLKRRRKASAVTCLQSAPSRSAAQAACEEELPRAPHVARRTLGEKRLWREPHAKAGAGPPLSVLGVVLTDLAILTLAAATRGITSPKSWA